MNLIAVACVYLGFAVALAGLVALIHPPHALGLETRAQGAAVLLAGLLLVAAGWLLPAREIRVSPARTRLDEVVPAYQFNEVHRIRVAAPPADVYRAIREVTAGEIRFFAALTAIRRFGRPGPESILNAPERLPILEVATRTTFVTLAEEVGRELVVGTLVIRPHRPDEPPVTRATFGSLSRPGYAKAAMNFLLEPDGRGGTLLSTETRVFATDAATRRRFATYWRLIYPGSALIRREWLRAVRRRAERASPAPPRPAAG